MLGIYLLILFGFIFSRGFFNLQSFFMMCVGFLIFYFSLFKNKLFSVLNISPELLLIILIGLSITNYGGLYQNDKTLVLWSYLFLSISLILSFFLENTKFKERVFFLIIIISIILRVFMINSSPNPRIDVYDYLKHGAEGLVEGKNPYSIIYTPLYAGQTPNFYSYLPSMILITTPFVIFFGDPRITFITAEILITFLIFHLLKNNSKRYIYSLLPVFNPLSLYMIEQSYTEILLVLLFALTAFCLIKKKLLWASLVFGVLLSTKQYGFFVIPILLKVFTRFKDFLKFLTFSALTALVISLPFFLWDKEDFIHDAIMLQQNFPPRYEGLTFFSFLHTQGMDYNFLLGNSIIILLAIPIYFLKSKKISTFFYSSALIYLIFFFFNKWSFINYYYLIAQLILMGVVFSEVEKGKEGTL